MKYLRLIVWHILPTVTVFLALLGIQLIPLTAFGIIVALFGTGETGSVFTWELTCGFLLLVSRAFLPSIGLLFITLVLDRLVRHRAVWLKIVLPFPFILVTLLLVYIWFQIPVPEDELVWWSVMIDWVMSMLVLLTATLTPYWYILQTQRFVVWLLKKAVSATTRSLEPSNQ